MDISADLTELGRTPVAVVCAGAKSVRGHVTTKGSQHAVGQLARCRCPMQGSLLAPQQLHLWAHASLVCREVHVAFACKFGACLPQLTQVFALLGFGHTSYT